MVKNHSVNILILVIIAVGVFFRSLNINFVGDDLLHISYSWESFKEIAFHYFRPLTNLSLLLDKSLWGYNNPAFHATNLFIHIVNTTLVYFLSLRFNSSRLPALSAALFFLLLPVHSASLFWISGRVDMLCSVFYLVSLITFIDHQNAGSNKFYIISISSFILAISSKEMALSLPLVLTAYVWVCSDKLNFRSLLHAARKCGAYWGILVIFAVFRITTAGYDAINSGVHSNYHPVQLAKNLAIFLGLLVVPGGHIEISNFLKENSAVFILLSLFVLVVLAISFKWIIRQRLLLFFSLFLLMGLLPVLRLAMRWYLYIPSIGFCLALAYTLYLLSVRSKFMKIGALAVAVVIAFTYTIFINIEQNRWLKAGELSKSISTEIAQKLDLSNAKQCLILAAPGEFEETPVLIHGIESLVRYRIGEAVDSPNGVKVESASLVSIRNFDSNSYPHLDIIDNKKVKLTLRNTSSYFVFPEEREIVAGLKKFEPNYVMSQPAFEVDVEGLNGFGQVNTITITIKAGSLPVYLWGEEGMIKIAM